MQPYHAAEAIGLPAASELLRRCEEGSRRFALAAIRAAASEIRKHGCDVVASGILLAAGKPLGSLEDTLASHAKIHTADGEHFRDAIARAADRCGLAVTRVRERDVWKKAAEKVEIPIESFQTRIAELGKTLGPPWRQDEKLAAAAACLALAGR